MKVLLISTDRKILDPNSGVSHRVAEYRKLFDELHVVVFNGKVWGLFEVFQNAKKIIENSKLKIENLVLSTQDPFETGLVGLLLKLRYKLPLQVQLHTDFANKYFITHSVLNFIRFPLGLLVLSFADSVRVVSERVARSIHSLSHNVSVLPISTSLLAPRSPLLAKERDGNREINFLTVARLEKEKDLETGLKAFAEANLNATFTIVGDGSQRERLQDLVHSLQLEEKVKFVGWQKTLEDYYKNADIYISTSLYEGYGMSVAEAALFGLPLILSDAGVAGDIFRNGDPSNPSGQASALVCKPKSVNEFREAMLKLSKDQNLRQEMGQKAKKMAESKQISHLEYLNKYKNSLEEAIKFHHSALGIFEKNILLRYLVAGFTGAGTNIGLLYIFTDIVHIWYLYSSALAFAVAVIVSFVLQKFWTFADKGTEKMHHQFARFLAVAVLGIIANTAFMYVLVDLFGIWYIFAQIITAAFIAILNFLMYKFFIFNKSEQ